MGKENGVRQDSLNEGRDEYFLDIDRMVNEGLGSGLVTDQNGLIEETTTETMDGAYTTNEAYRQQERS